MRRTTTRGPRLRTAGPRRPSSRTRRRPASSRRPLLSPTQVREGAGLVLVAASLLGLFSMVWGGGPVMLGLRGALERAFGIGWALPVLAVALAGGYLLWPRRVAPRTPAVLGAMASALALFGLLSLTSAAAGGALGRSVEGFLAGLTAPAGAAVILGLILLLGLVVAFRFSPGAVLLGAMDAARSGYAERRRLEALVRRPAAAGGVPVTSAPASTTLAASAPAPAVSRAQAPPAPTGGDPEALIAAGALVPAGVAEARSWAPVKPLPDLDGGDDVEPPALRVVADPEDDLPDVDWQLPPMSLLDSVTARKERMQEEIKRNVRVIEATLSTFGVEARVVGVNSGPAVTQYELSPAAGVQVKRIVALQNDLSLALAASPLRIEAPIPGKSAVGIEVPNRSASLVSIREVVEAPAFRSGSHLLPIALGNDVAGQSITADLTRMPHLLIAGATGQGKSVCLNVLITSLLLQATPDRLKLVMIDPKRVELSGYNGLPHLAAPVLVDAHQAAAALRWAVAEMDRRYKLLSAEGVRNVAGYNEKAAAVQARPLPYVVIVVDELADLMMVAAGEIEELVCRIAQLARAVGIHLVIATQRPSTDIITGLIKANIPSRIAFAVSSQIDSRVILDTTGAEKLLGRGDMLYQPVDAGKPTRIQGAFISEGELEAVIRFWKAQGEPRFLEEVLEADTLPEPSAGSPRRLDPLFGRAARAVAAEGGASVSLVQRKFNVGYSRAGRIVDQLAEHRVIGGYQGSKSREVLMNLPDVDELLERLGLEG